MPLSVRFRALTVNTKKYDADWLKLDIEYIMQRWGENVIRKVRRYPPPRSESRYQRTYQLQSGWELDGPRQVGNGFIMYVKNDVPYATYVQGDQQTWFHAETGWSLLEDEDILDRPGYMKSLRKVYQQYADKAGD